MILEFTTSVEVAWGDCDAAGIVFYPQFFRFMDTAFHRLLRSRGTGQRELQGEFGVLGTPLMEASAVFKSPARYDDILAMRVVIEELGPKIIRIAYSASLGDRLVFTGREVRALVAERDGKLKSVELPEAFRSLFGV